MDDKRGIKRKRQSYETSFKLKVISYAEENGNRAAEREFGISEKLVRDWRKNKDILLKTRRDKRANRGKSAFWPDLEKLLMTWVEDTRAKALPVSRNMIRLKAMTAAKEMKLENFKCSLRWLSGFMKRQRLSLREKTRISQKMPRDYEEKTVEFQRFIIRMREKHNYELSQIGNMDEVPMYFDMLPSKTVNKMGAKTVQLKTTGHEKSHFTVVLACMSDGTKLKPTVIFKRKTMPKEKFVTGVNVRVHQKGWVDEGGMLEWMDSVWATRPGGLLKKRSLLVLDSFRAHLCDSVRDKGKKLKCDLGVIPGGMTSVLQPLDVCLNKPFKEKMRKRWCEWMCDPAEKAITPSGNLKRPSLSMVTAWVKDSWDEIDTSMVVKSFKKCSISNAMDGTEDDELYSEFICTKGAGKVVEKGEKKVEKAEKKVEKAEVEKGEKKVEKCEKRVEKAEVEKAERRVEKEYESSSKNVCEKGMCEQENKSGYSSECENDDECDLDDSFCHVYDDELSPSDWFKLFIDCDSDGESDSECFFNK